MLLPFFGGFGDVGGDVGIGDETLTLLALLLKTWCLPGAVGLREWCRCKELDLSDTELVGLVSEPADSAFLLFASSRAATSARDNCTGGGANMSAQVVSHKKTRRRTVFRDKRHASCWTFHTLAAPLSSLCPQPAASFRAAQRTRTN